MPARSPSSVGDALHAVAIGAPRRAGGLVQFPLLSAVAGPPAWLTAQDAVEQFVLEAREIQDAPHVAELRLLNHFDLPVLVVSGELLIGAKSNRVVNSTLLLRPRSSLNAPVSCVEAGRWGGAHHTRRVGPCAPVRLRSALTQQVSRQLEASTRVQPELSPTAARYADQKEIWREVAMLLKALPEATSTLDLASAYTTRASLLEQLTAAHSSVAFQVGSIFSSPSRGILGLELCSDPTTYNRLLPRLVQGYAIEIALPAPLGPVQRVTEEQARDFLCAVAETRVRSYPALGLGDELRLASADVVGSAVFLRDEVIHLCAFPAQAGALRGGV
jgi:hypothetical protein